jgi:hypothetical protein
MRFHNTTNSGTTIAYQSSIQLVAAIVRPIIKSTDHKESNPSNFSLMSPLIVLSQYTHPSLSTNCKFDYLPTSLYQEVAQKELKAQTLSLFDNSRLSKQKVLELPQMWVLLPIQTSSPISPKTQHFIMHIQHIAIKVTLGTPLDHHHFF